MWTWYVARATGLVALVLFTGTVLLGITGAVRFATAGWPRFVLGRLHRNVSLLAVVFLVVHLVTVVVDGDVDVGWPATVVPFVAAYHPFWLGLGTTAFDLVLALVATSLLRARLGLRAWRAVHRAAYAAWPLALVHGLGIGTDSGTSWVLGVAVGCLLLVGAGLAWRVTVARREPVATSVGAASPRVAR